MYVLLCVQSTRPSIICRANPPAECAISTTPSSCASVSNASSILSKYHATVGRGFKVPVQYSGVTTPTAFRSQSVRATLIVVTE